MSTKSIQIQTNPKPTLTQPAVFAPATVVANAGDNLTWHNADKQDHWPAPSPSASNPSGWVQFRIPPGSVSRGDLALAPNVLAVTGATNANPVVLTLDGAAPPSGTKVTMAYFAPTPALPDASPWADLDGQTLVATIVGTNSCSIPVDSSKFGPLTPAQGSLTLASPLAYTLNYECALHPAEKGTITVNPQA
jgi:plastocyanin